MIQATVPCDPAIHRAAILIAQRFANLVGGILRDEEKGECERECYIIAREVIEEMNRSK